jgi:SPP1 family predicted phage head-tail adaptor
MHPSAFLPGRAPPISALDKRITIQQAVTTQDAVGGQVVTWSDVATVWAHVHPLAGRELINAQSVYAAVTHNMIIRWQSQFDDPQTVAKMRISYSGRLFNIGAAVHLEEGRRFVVLSVSEGLNDG